MSESLTEIDNVYVTEVQKALFAFQMIEEGLKNYVGVSYEIIKRSAPPPVVFNFNASAINNAPLGKLIKMFSSISANNQLIGDLHKVEEWRNFCAHRAFIHEFISRQSGIPVTEKDVEDVRTITTFAFNLVHQIGNDMIILQKTHVFEAASESDNEVA
jgi:hypothetical protein